MATVGKKTTTIEQEVILEDSIQEKTTFITEEIKQTKRRWSNAWPIKFIFSKWPFIGGFLASPKYAYGIGKFLSSAFIILSISLAHAFDIFELFDCKTNKSIGIKIGFAIISSTVFWIAGISVYGFFSFISKYQDSEIVVINNI